MNEWAEFTANVLSLLVPLLLSWIALRVRQWGAANLDDRQRKMLNHLVQQAVGLAEHKARSALKGSKTVVSGQAKHALAMDFIDRNASGYGVTLPDSEELQEHIEAEVGRLKVAKPPS